MDKNLENNTNALEGVAPDWVLYTISGLLFFMFGFGGSFVYSSWDTISELFYESSLARYETMTGDRGPATCLVFHDDDSNTLRNSNSAIQLSL